jgi:hypothetical protein
VERRQYGLGGFVLDEHAVFWVIRRARISSEARLKSLFWRLFVPKVLGAPMILVVYSMKGCGGVDVGDVLRCLVVSLNLRNALFMHWELSEEEAKP